jgi:hypothetical protein
MLKAKAAFAAFCGESESLFVSYFESLTLP